MDGLQIGRVVHFVWDYSTHLPAIIMEVPAESDGECLLRILHKHSPNMDRIESVSYSEKLEKGTWHWPERV
jgi:hypothetical protein